MEKEFFKVGADGQLELPINPDKELFVANAMNEIGFKEFTNFELDIFYTLCAVLSNTPEGQYILDLKELKRALKKNKYSDKQILETIDRLTDKLTVSKEFKNAQGETIKGSMFVTATPTNCDYIRVSVSPEHRFLINDLHQNFTKIEMKEFIDLKSVHSKKLYRILRQFDDKGLVRIKIEDLRKVLGIKDSYSNKYMVRDIINPAIEELKDIFPALSCKANQNEHKRGKPITSYEFFWTPRRNIIEEKQELDKKKAQRVQKAKAIIKESGEEIPSKNNKFSNFNERKYDYDALMGDLMKPRSRELTAEEKAEYEELTEGATQEELKL